MTTTMSLGRDAENLAALQTMHHAQMVEELLDMKDWLVSHLETNHPAALESNTQLAKPDQSDMQTAARGVMQSIQEVSSTVALLVMSHLTCGRLGTT
jgi:hypothetical protein